ncbi:radical SAM/SPASM domain-containing protein [Bacteroidia bacterium]|nr:radical SAM/SPASM domain-containing protein [Bacteroidia bacterium]GHT03260.1 radical SAM/SPASM domain-containing protein [Bacteroidia bacterium]GHT45548.1 radical SAM/SPASM domain-containing protein [Bacteroidia bacterium]
MEQYRLSKYNHFLKKREKVTGVNLYNRRLFSIDRGKYDLLMSYKTDLSRLKEEQPVLFSTMYKLGIIEDITINIPNILLLKNRQQVFQNKTYRLFINPTLNCNFSCWYCYEQHNKKRMSSEVMNNTVKYIENLITKEKIQYLHIDWFGGEPLLCYKTVIKPISVEAQRICEQNNVNFCMTMTTNGFLVKPEMISFFEEHKYIRFQITIDGDKESHNRTRFQGDSQNGSYDTIVNNIGLLTRLPNVRIVLRINFTREILSRCVHIIDCFPEETRNKIQVDLVQVWQDSRQNKDSDWKDIWANEKKIKNIFLDAGFVIPNRSFEHNKYHTCFADLNNEAIINYDGRVFKCTAVDFENEKEEGILNNIGEIIWDEDALGKRLAKSPFDNKKCFKCDYLPICFGKCSTNYFIRKKMDNCILRPLLKGNLYEKMNIFNKSDYKIAYLHQI